MLPTTIGVAAILLVAGGAAAFDDLLDGIQEDGGVPGDAADTCDAISAVRSVAVDEAKRTNGMFIPNDDESDFYALPTGTELLGVRVQVRIEPSDGNLASLSLDIQLPGCGGSVFDPETFDEQRAALHSHPEYSPTEPPAPGEKTVAAHSLNGACDPTEWHFVINKVAGGAAPDHIRVQWSNGDIANIPIVKETPATVVHYRSTLNLDQPIWAANVNIFKDWTGRFNLGSGPCNGPATAPEDPFVPPFTEGSEGQFTVVYQDPYGAGGFLEGFTGPSFAAQRRGTSGHAMADKADQTCHDFCSLLFSYDFLAVPIPEGSPS